MSAEQGLVTAAHLVVQPDRPPRRRAEQLDLDFLGMPAYQDRGGAQVVPVPERLDDPAENESEDGRRRGSRAGIRNKRTEEWLAYFAQRYRSPVENLLAMGNMSIEELSRSLRCSALEAANIKIRCNEAA